MAWFSHMLKFGLAFWVGLLFAAPADAQPAIEGYSDYETYRARLEKLAESPLVALTSLGQTLGEREVFLLTVSEGQADVKPALLVMGNVHAPHLVGSELAVRVVENLLQRAGEDEAAARLLSDYTLYVIPRPSPDASEHFFRRPQWERATNERPTDDDRDGEVGEDPLNDLNGDGLFTMMRVEDPTGKYFPHPDDPRVMIEADPLKDERGGWSLYTEGIDDDGDGQFNEDGPGGVDFNRNFTHRYPYFEPGAGPHQVSEIETRAVADFAFSKPNIALVFSFAPEDNLMNPWKPNSSSEGNRFKTAIRNGDARYADLVAERFRKIHGGKEAPSSPDTPGGFVPWAYFHYGRWSFASRAWWVPKVEPAEKAAQEDETADEAKPSGEKRGSEQLRALRWLEHEQIDGFVDWTPVDHPDFPGRRVEVGGFKPYLLLNPPAGEIDALADKHTAFLLELASLLPDVKLEEPKVEALGEGLYRLTATVINHGYLPTESVQGRQSGYVHPVQVQVVVSEGMKLLNAAPRTQLPPIAGRGGKAERSWLIAVEGDAPREVTVKTWSPTAGSDEHKIELK